MAEPKASDPAYFANVGDTRSTLVPPTLRAGEKRYDPDGTTTRNSSRVMKRNIYRNQFGFTQMMVVRQLTNVDGILLILAR